MGRAKYVSSSEKLMEISTDPPSKVPRHHSLLELGADGPASSVLLEEKDLVPSVVTPVSFPAWLQCRPRTQTSPQEQHSSLMTAAHSWRCHIPPLRPRNSTETGMAGVTWGSLGRTDKEQQLGKERSSFPGHFYTPAPSPATSCSPTRATVCWNLPLAKSSVHAVLSGP